MHNEILYFLTSAVLALPRIIIPAMWIFFRWFLTDPFANWWWILLGFLFAPFTLLLYCGWYHFGGLDLNSWQWAILIIIGCAECIFSLAQFRSTIWATD
jgi:hypothetical protein